MNRAGLPWVVLGAELAVLAALWLALGWAPILALLALVATAIVYGLYLAHVFPDRPWPLRGWRERRFRVYAGDEPERGVAFEVTDDPEVEYD